MSLALIQECAKEVRRLAIAGSPLAVGDFRLKKLIGPLEQAGSKVPVFAQVAKAVGDVVNGTESDSATHLLGLGTLLNAILYTQGQTGADGSYRELETLATNTWSTRTPARVLKPLVEALTTKGGGRFEVVKTACDRGAFNDLRLIDPAIRALGDSYPELADLVANKVLPGYGPGIVPLLKAKLDLKGTKQDGRRLAIMHQLDPAGSIELCRSALDEGSPDVKVYAIGCLGKHDDCIPLVLEQAKSKNKALRTAALEALAEHDRPEITKLFTELLKGKALDFIVRPFRAVHNRQVFASLLDEGKRAFDLVLGGDSEQITRCWEILDCLEGRKEPEAEEFLLNCFCQGEKASKLKAAKNSHLAGSDLATRLASLLCDIGSTKALEAVLAKRDVLPPGAFSQVLRSALLTWAPEKVFEEFAPLLQQKKGAAKEKSEELQRAIWARNTGDNVDLEVTEGENPSQAQALREVKWDPRWLDAAIKADQQIMACCLARPGHEGAITYFLKTIESKGQSQAGLIIQALARCQHEKVTDVFLDLVARKTKGARYFDYDLQLLFESARHLPAHDLPKLDAFATKLDEKFVDKYLESLEPLRPAKQP